MQIILSDHKLGIFACLVTVICWTAGTFAFTRAARMVAPASVNRVRLLFAFVIIAFISCIVQGITPWQLLQLPDKEQLFYFAVSGFIGFTLGDFFLFTAFKILGGRRTTLFNCFAPVSALIFAFFLVDEHISLTGILGMLISVGGVLMLTLSRSEQSAVHEE